MSLCLILWSVFSVLTARELAGMYGDLASSLRIRHSGPLAYFKMHARTDDSYSGRDDDGGRDASGPDPDGDETGDDDAGVPAPGVRLAVPLDYSRKAYYSLITWLVNPR